MEKNILQREKYVNILECYGVHKKVRVLSVMREIGEN